MSQGRAVVGDSESDLLSLLGLAVLDLQDCWVSVLQPLDSIAFTNAARLEACPPLRSLPGSGGHWMLLWAAADRAKAGEALLAASQGEIATFTGDLEDSSTGRFSWDVTIGPFPGSGAGELVVVAREATQRVSLLRTIADQTRFSKLAKDIAGVGYWRLDLTTGAVTWSEQMFKLYGLPPGAPPDLDEAMARVHSADRARDDLRLKRAVTTGRGWKDSVSRIQGGDGQWRVVQGRAICEKSPDGTVTAIFGTAIDVTEAKAQVELFETAFEHAPIGMCLVALDGHFLKVNDALCDLVGYPRDELLALRFHAITHAEDIDADLELLRQLLKGTIPRYQMKKRYLTAGGSEIWARLSVTLVKDADGRPQHFISQVEDLTAEHAARSALAESEARYRLMADHSTDMIVATDSDGRVTFATPSCHAVLGFGSHELIGRRPLDYIHPDDAPAVAAAFKHLAARGESQRLRWRVRHNTEDRWVWLESNASLLAKDAAPGEGKFLDVIRDVTGQVEQERRLAEATDAAQAAAGAKSQFLANMSHEIRTPLTAILGFARLMDEAARLQEPDKGYLRRIASAGEALLAIVNDVLDFSKLEAGACDLKPRVVATREVLEETLLLFAPQADAKGLRLVFDPQGPLPPFVELDPDRLRQILLNLIGNAIKFTDRGAVTLRAGYKAGALAISVTDTGPGLDAEQQARLFQRFSQVDASSTRRFGGTGLGLAICKGLVEAMGGEIGVSSTPPAGATFHFTVAATESAPLEQASAMPLQCTTEGLRVLVADDNRANRDLVRIILENLGMEVAEAVDGRQAVARALEQPFDVILLDLRMPELDGLDALRLIRRDGPNLAAPIVAFSADLTSEDLSAFDDHLSKPIIAEALITTIVRAANNLHAPETHAKIA